MTNISSISGGAYQSQNTFSRTDKDGNGKVTEEEFVSARPKAMNETQSSKLYDKLSGGSEEGLTEEQLKESIESLRPSAADKFGGEIAARMLALQQDASGSTGNEQSAPVDYLMDSLDAVASDDEE
ncbi:hypothetical protein HFC70_06830 [Agrobacterium sp. a22-2]|uniref:hypothetical protein n=1 Tax=Agrobacterium sp. a22-2 TaxID=2283840 RepID=UPI0014458626|nr:hypothetical protein [Agrobacterium sp. a22-2]NKN36070.1 hypothetical protein [Agrobacterium sp. a22-2]